MRIALAIVATLAMAAVSAAAAPTASLRYAGMTYTNERYCPNVTLASPGGLRSLDHLATTGANAVAVVVTWYQWNLTSTEIYPVRDAVRCTTTPSGYCVTAADDEVRRAIAHVHSMGQRVLLKPHIDLLNASGYWRGQIGTNMTKAQWARWFASYTYFIQHYARLAEATGVELFSVSTELITPSTQAAYWRDEVVPAIRAAYTGRLTDAANWATPSGEGELTHKTWWDLVDVIGVDEYYVTFHFTNYVPATSDDDDDASDEDAAAAAVDPPPGLRYRTAEELEVLWQPIVRQLTNLSAHWNKSVVFTEVGFCAGVNGSCYANGAAPPPPGVPETSAASLAAQAAQYEALLRVFAPKPWFEGVFWWNWATDPAFGGPGNACMDPKFKPAEAVLRRWYGATVPRPPLPTTNATCQCWL